jgi:hypothetical protein
MFEPKKYVLLADMEADFSSSYVDPCPGSPQEWSPKYEIDSEVSLHIHYHKVAKDEGISYLHYDVFDYLLTLTNDHF